MFKANTHLILIGVTSGLQAPLLAEQICQDFIQICSFWILHQNLIIDGILYGDYIINPLGPDASHCVIIGSGDSFQSVGQLVSQSSPAWHQAIT